MSTDKRLAALGAMSELVKQIYDEFNRENGTSVPLPPK